MPRRRVIQRLYDTCEEVFADCGPGVVPSDDDVLRLQALLDNMIPSDVGLNPNLPFFRNMAADGPPPVTYIHIHEQQNFSIGIFCLPQMAVIPLHNHPGMTVFSKLLFGSMHIKSYDWVGGPEGANRRIEAANNTCLAKVNTDAVFRAPCKTSILYPAAGGNLHCFTAVTPCAVLDILGPPYDDNEGRGCSYYNEFPYSSFQNDAIVVPDEDEEKYAWLEVRERPPDYFNVHGGEYSGPAIVRR